MHFVWLNRNIEIFNHRYRSLIRLFSAFISRKNISIWDSGLFFSFTDVWITYLCTMFQIEITYLLLKKDRVQILNKLNALTEYDMQCSKCLKQYFSTTVDLSSAQHCANFSLGQKTRLFNKWYEHIISLCDVQHLKGVEEKKFWKWQLKSFECTTESQ